LNYYSTVDTIEYSVKIVASCINVSLEEHLLAAPTPNTSKEKKSSLGPY
jgi:hypothetical protein